MTAMRFRNRPSAASSRDEGAARDLAYSDGVGA